MTRREWKEKKMEKERRLQQANSALSDCKDLKIDSLKLVLRGVFRKKPEPALVIMGACGYALLGLCETWITGKVIPNIR